MSACLHVCVQVKGMMNHLADTSHSIYIAISLHLSGNSLTHFACDLFSPSSLTPSFFFSLTSCLHVFFPADVLTDRVIALEADAWTRDDIALHHELMLKLGRISGIHPYTSHLIIQGGGEMCLWT